ncbi:hypothetical protein [Pseudoroseicyclus aestuarii]|uniref:Uncharacterized protein n=1 Tax=Pseudoroseicyclus aestuarii TaxID=1795041 RepID=A0A318SSB0_9RHOB|nr:hypothetical protein [Pseudoroseicyclus aestuarii]PYE84593.1 hypothetical protein DFP88_102394 [Pseudoroseicyclus aestuarii]
MSLIADMLLVAGALAAALYCMVLSRRLRRFTDLESGVGGAVAVLSAQVDDLTRTVARARDAASTQVGTLNAATDRAEAAAKRLELLVASLHDLPEPQADQPEAEAPPEPYFIRNVDLEVTP